MKEEVKELWKLCFDDNDEFVEMYFRLRYSSETTMTIQSGNKVVSSLQMPYYPMTFEGIEIQTAYISGACTHPDFRGKGVMSQLLAESFSRMVQKNIPLSILIPANRGLYDYYAKTGYAPAFFRTPIEENVSDIPANKGNLQFKHITSFDKSLFDYCTEKAYSRPNYVQHTAEDFKAIMEDLRIGGGSAILAQHPSDGNPGAAPRCRGVLFAYPEDNYLKVSDCFADNNTIRDSLIREAAHHYDLSTIVRYELPEHSDKEEPFGMARIIHAKMILHLYAATHPDKQININLTDEQLTFNTGYYYINKGTCTFSKKPLEGEHLELSTQELSTLIFDEVRLYMSLMLE
ncbi:GNAT family N-acetyltransferase [Bacteroides sp. 51]|uniref:GNAT family N-acetyltransferase n=1 Tax=Bacteroides sp. 51 TaxID=2302938 RepID=UPI0013CFA0CA|nr:GNAT family N-acetyltransferase [Bacteroides sp. 51]NDV84871.1 GNAT family N-acetyltransferase [Bacteroides sp. 51]